MTHSIFKTRSQSGDALIGIIVIVIILILSGIYFYRTTREQILENKVSEERAALEQNAGTQLDANALGASTSTQ